MDDELIIELDDIPMPPNFPEHESEFVSFQGNSNPSFQQSYSAPSQHTYQPTAPFQHSYQPQAPLPQSYQPHVPLPQSYRPSVPFPQTYHPPSLKIPPSFQSVEMPELYTPKSNMSYQSQSEIQYESHKRASSVYDSQKENHVTQFEGTEVPEVTAVTAVTAVTSVTETDQEKEEAWYTVITKSLSDHSVTIHSIADLIFFYMFFKYTRNKYAETQIKIDDTKELIKKIQRQYGLNVKRITK